MERSALEGWVIELLADSQWAFALFLSKVRLVDRVFAFKMLTCGVQLPDLHAPTHSFKVLQQAMQETIATITQLTEEAGITSEV